MLKRLQDCYPTSADYFFPPVKAGSSQSKDTPFPLTNIPACGTDLGNAELPMEQSSNAAESTGPLTYTGTMPEGPYLYLLSSHSLNPAFEKLINLKL